MSLGKRVASLTFASGLLGITASAWADPVTVFNGLDAGAGPASARPNSNAAHAAWSAAATAGGASLNTIDFESQAVGYTTGFVADLFTTVSLSGTLNEADAGITSAVGDAILGYNVTSGGGKHLRVVGDFGGVVDTTFAFSTAITSWGAFITGRGTVSATMTLLFNNGTNEVINVTGATNGGALFVGFTSLTGVSQVVIHEVNASGVRDIYGVDNVGYTLIPLPPAAWAGLTGLGMVAGIRRLRRTA